MLFTFGAGSAPSASSDASSQSGAAGNAAISGPVINLNGPGEVSPVLVGGVAVVVLFSVIMFFVMRKK